MHAKIKIFSFCLVVLAAIAALTLLRAPPKDASSLVVGLQSGYPPYEYMDSDGQIVGFDVELAALIAGKLGKNLVIKDMEFEGEILSLKQGKIDLIMSGMSITPSRLKEIAMIPYHGEKAATWSLLFWEKVPAGIASIEDLATLPSPTVSVESGSVQEEYLARYPQLQVKSFQGALAPLMDVKYGKSAANLVAADVADYLIGKHPEIKSLEVPLQEMSTLGDGIGIKKENHALIQQVEGIVQELKASGQLKALEDKWFKGGV